MENDELTYTVIGCAMAVYNKLGNGFQEVINQRCLAIELGKTQLSFAREVEHPIFYDDIEVGTRRSDFIIDAKLVVEPKAKNYLVAYQFQKGLLINFGATSLQYKLVFNNNSKYNVTL